MEKRPFLITIDTEGDNIWVGPRTIQTENARFLPRFQALCEKYQLKPTYLTNYEMATSPVFIEFAQDVINRDAAEIGMHLHAWNSPPLIALTADDFKYQPYLIEYPEAVLTQKVDFMTKTLEDTFGVKMTSHRSGRWAFNEVYAQALIKQGYLVDCSVTPHVDWSDNLGDPNQAGGTDFRNFPKIPYFINPNNIQEPGQSSLLELPVSIVNFYPFRPLLFKSNLFAPKWINKKFPLRWLRPNGRNLNVLQSVLNKLLQQNMPYAQFMLHSSELMPGGSPTFKTEDSIEKLYDELEGLFAGLGDRFYGQTLTGYYQDSSCLCSMRSSSSSSSICST